MHEKCFGKVSKLEMRGKANVTRPFLCCWRYLANMIKWSGICTLWRLFKFQ